MMAALLSQQAEKLKRWSSAWLVTWAITVALHVVATGLLFWFVRSRDELVILRYNSFLGIDLLGVWWQLFLVPGLTFFFTLINFVLARLFWKRHRTEIAALFLIGNILLSLSVTVVTLTLSFINV